MNDAQVERILGELQKTRESFEDTTRLFNDAINSIKWNRWNTIIQYVLIAAVFVLGAVGVVNYMNYRHGACERTNETRTVVSNGMELNAFAIGSALAAVLGGSQEDLEAYLNAYHDQKATEAIQLLEC